MSGNVVTVCLSSAESLARSPVGSVHRPGIRCPRPSDSRGKPMALPFGYEGKRVVVSGGGGAGMGAAAVEGLAELGAEIHVIDLKQPPVPVASHQVVDLRDPEATTGAIDAIGGTIDALFNCAGLPGPPKFS